MTLWHYLGVVAASLGISLAQAAPQTFVDTAPIADILPESVAPDSNTATEAAEDKTIPTLSAASVAAAGKVADQPWTPDRLYQHVIDKAQTLAGEDYRPQDEALPVALREMSYDDYRNIRFRQEQALWKDAGLFEVQFFHPGFLYKVPVEITLDEDNRLEPLPFDTQMFRYEGESQDVKQALSEKNASTRGFAGFRLHYPLNTPDYKDEVVSFLGASYFRPIGRGQIYGLSARGLAVNTATPEGEEFPAFRAFWLMKPAPDASRITLMALLDSPSVTGAYRFDFDIGENTVAEVQARLFARQDVKKLGAAPLTSMFLHGENSVKKPDDFRPEVHDSDGLLVHTAEDQWIWRPLSNPRELNVTQLRDRSPQGFGLMQRDRNFEHYQDMEANYHRRPSLWVEPLEGDWEEGGVELVEIPTKAEIHDNIAAYWVPDKPLKKGETRYFRYRLSTLDNQPRAMQVARVVRTRSGWGATPGRQNQPSHEALRHFIVDFRGGELAGLDSSQPVQAQLNSSTGEVSQVKVTKLPDERTWRASFKLAPEGDKVADMQLHLSLRDKPLSETWSYLWNPKGHAF
ncbi:glucan biosynthesis protein [Pistricoccus aurantiacus]|uniref:Glucan biosynthesis protein n=1 Tax=Pistricoccus aurantiacus TaxID=1883414 RepID=A0A5B8SU04_9GAMM|nr:glucan biosynthesis protein G [Pistricoccus aurantiacus]QEA40622.1 glucan biosynthesis protein [Pistricoccus aurantiacus]